jgi:hypothetical protein
MEEKDTCELGTLVFLQNMLVYFLAEWWQNILLTND